MDLLSSADRREAGRIRVMTIGKTEITYEMPRVTILGHESCELRMENISHSGLCATVKTEKGIQ